MYINKPLVYKVSRKPDINLPSISENHQERHKVNLGRIKRLHNTMYGRLSKSNSINGRYLSYEGLDMLIKINTRWAKNQLTQHVSANKNRGIKS